jgi:parallel beta-helix repeat protein
VTITGNTASNRGGGMFLSYSNPTLTHVTITNNTADEGGGMRLSFSNPTLTNSIVWNNSPESIYINSGTPVITYSDIEGGWEGEGNIDADPLFADSDNGDYTLQEGSPCIDSGNPNLWYQDVDGTPSDMGATGGLFVLPNFTSHDFGEVGDIGSSKQFTLYNYRETPITISTVSFGTASFTAGTSFPITIEPLKTGIINIEANNTSFEYVEDAMEIASDDLPEGLSVSLSITGTEGNVLTGNLSGTYPAATYRISGDLTVADGDTLYLHPGTQFLFDGEYDFTIYGTLKAIGTESDSIMFRNFNDSTKWRGFTLENALDETEFRYVRISGAEKDDGGGMYLNSSNPTLTNVTISNNTANNENNNFATCGGMYLSSSNPTLTHVTISGNTANFAGGMYLLSSNPTLSNVTITGNTADWSGGGMYLDDSNPTLTHVTITDNTADEGGGMYLWESNPTLTNSIIWDNSPGSMGGYYSTPIITYSDIEGGWEGEGNIDIDPLFTNPENGNYTLQEDSPCIDAGIIIEDMEYYGIAPDMGASESGESSEIMAGDTNFDGIVDILDIVRIINQIMGNSEFNDDEFTAADFNQDGIVDILDIVQIVNYILPD